MTLNLREWLASTSQFMLFAFRGGRAALKSVPRLSWWIRPFHGAVVGALPVSIVLGVALGVVIWIHTRDILARTPGAADYLPTILSVAVLLELAPVGAGLIVAARTGASLGAELSSMKVTEQIDALELLGVSPLRCIIGPRVLACVLAVPVLNVLIAATALLSGFVAESVVGSTTMLKYQTAAMRELYFSDVLPAAGKTLVFGFAVGVTGCFIGLAAKEGSEGVGQAATDSVVACTLLVLASDVIVVELIEAALG